MPETDGKEPRVTATHRGLHLDGHFIVTWAELDRVRGLLHTISSEPVIQEPLSKSHMAAIVAGEYPYNTDPASPFKKQEGF